MEILPAMEIDRRQNFLCRLQTYCGLRVGPMTSILGIQIMKRISQKIRQRGQGMTEYIIIVALIAVAAIAVYQLFGATVRNQTAGIAMEVAGKDGKPAIDAAAAAAQKAATRAKQGDANSLSSYGDQATAGQQGGGQ
jgi:Flp pilus assembly pilin Flp